MKIRLMTVAALCVAGMFGVAYAAESEVPADAAPVVAPAGETGTVIFFRPKKIMGAAIGFKVREGETELGKLRNGKYFVLPVAPGTHEYVVHSEAKDKLVL